MLGGVNIFEHEREGKEERIMQIFMKKELRVYVNAVIEE